VAGLLGAVLRWPIAAAGCAAAFPAVPPGNWWPGARHRRRSRHGLPLRAALHAGVHRSRPAVPPPSRRPAARRRGYVKVAGHWTYLCRGCPPGRRCHRRAAARARRVPSRGQSGHRPGGLSAGSGRAGPRGSACRRAVHEQPGHGRLEASTRGLNTAGPRRILATAHVFAKNSAAAAARSLPEGQGARTVPALQTPGRSR
jgi:hypothetical protein